MRTLMIRAALSAALVAAVPPAVAQVAGKTPEQAWAWSMANTSGDDVAELYGVLNDVGYVRQQVTAEKCRKNADRLAVTLAKVPVSLALHRTLQLCAESRGDKATADAEVGAFAALWKYAQQVSGSGAWARPIRIIVLNDAYAAFDAMGLEYDYEAYEDVRARGSLPIHVAGWDPERKVERHFRFDYLAAQAAVDRKNPNAGTAAHLNASAREFLDAYAKADELSALDAKAVQSAAEKDALAERIAALKPMAGKGGLLSLGTWMMVCGNKASPQHCADGLVDALLPLAEKKQGIAMVLLSTAYRNGIGIARDEKAADVLLDAADKQWWQRGASLLALRYHVMLHPDGEGLEPFARRLELAAKAGNPEAEPTRVAILLDLPPDKVIDASGIAELSKSTNNAQGTGYRLIAASLKKHGDDAAAKPWIEKAAAAGDAVSRRDLALARIQAHPGQVPDADTLALLRAAALDGDHLALRLLALREMMDHHWARAELQLLPGMIDGDMESTYLVADLWAQGYKGVTGKPETARAIYEALAVAPDGARARRELATLTLQGRAGLAKDGAKARGMVLQDARAGDAESQALYGAWLLDGAGGKQDVAEGRTWMDKAITAKSPAGISMYGSWLVQRSDAVADHARGIELLQRADKDGSSGARNNLAWAHCTSRFADVRAADKGLLVAKRMQDIDGPLEAGALDTVAACYAAAGQFDEAIRLQETVVAGAKAGVADGSVPESSLKSMVERLALFRKRQDYTEATPPKP